MTNRKIEYWIIPPESDAEFTACTEDVLEVYERPYDANCPVLNMDERSRRPAFPFPPRRSTPSEWTTNTSGQADTANIFMFTEPLAGWRDISVRSTKTEVDWALEFARLLEGRYAHCEKLILVCENLNTHTKGAFYEAFEPRRARDLVRFSYIVPDFLVTCRDGRRRLLEVKPARKLERPDVRRKLAVASEFARQQGWTFHVVTEQHLHQGSRLDNLRLLAKYRQVAFDADGSAQLIEWIATSPQTIDQLLNGNGTTSFTSTALRTTLYHLLATGQLSCDLLTAPLTSQTLIFDGGTHPWDPFASLWGPSGCSTDVPFASSGNQPVMSSQLST